MGIISEMVFLVIFVKFAPMKCMNSWRRAKDTAKIENDVTKKALRRRNNMDRVME